MPVYNPRKLTLARENYFEVVEHPELFKKLSQIVLDSPSFNFDIVPEKIKRADFGYFVKFVMDEEYRGKVTEYVSKFGESEIDIELAEDDKFCLLLDSLKTIKVVFIRGNLSGLKENYPDIKFRPLLSSLLH